MGRKKSSVHTTIHTVDEATSLLEKITSIFWKAFEGEISKIGNHNMKEVMPSWQALRSPNHS